MVLRTTSGITHFTWPGAADRREAALRAGLMAQSRFFARGQPARAPPRKPVTMSDQTQTAAERVSQYAAQGARARLGFPRERHPPCRPHPVVRSVFDPPARHAAAARAEARRRDGRARQQGGRARRPAVRRRRRTRAARRSGAAEAMTGESHGFLLPLQRTLDPITSSEDIMAQKR